VGVVFDYVVAGVVLSLKWLDSSVFVDVFVENVTGVVVVVEVDVVGVDVVKVYVAIDNRAKGVVFFVDVVVAETRCQCRLFCFC
jgi:hypothetical protein